MSRPTTARQVAILGAGIAGASAARALADAGIEVTVFDKGRAPGGRAATRARGPDHYDHGAQYFTARDPAFVRQVQLWVDAGVVALWQPRLVAIGAHSERSTLGAESRWVGVPGMDRLAASLLDGLDLRCGQRVVRVQRQDAGWWLEFADASSAGPFPALLCTLPAPQAAQLLEDEPLGLLAGEVLFAPCWALMAEFAQPLPLDFDAAFVNSGPLSWIARDASRPGRPAGERWLIHAGSDFSRAQLETAGEHVAGLLLDAFFAAINCPPQVPIRSVTHRWRFALAQPPLHVGALVDAKRRLALGGDWCQGSRVEGAWLSGQALAGQAREWSGIL